MIERMKRHKVFAAVILLLPAALWLLRHLLPGHG